MSIATNPFSPYSFVLQVYAESWLFRSQLKADIRTQVRNLKSLFPDSFTGSSQELQLQISNTVKMWAGDGAYLHDTVPGSVRISISHSPSIH